MSTSPDTAGTYAWEPALEYPLARRDEVHVWRAALLRPASEVEALRALLSADELGRADRFRFGRDRSNFVAARGILRTILGRYLRQTPSLLLFDYNQYGKPALRGAGGADALRFSVAHSGDIALYAVARGREVGIDIERVREGVACEEIAGNFFSHREVEMLRELPAGQRTEGFFNCWTRKEAFVKALGEGLSFPLSQFDVSLAPGEPATLLSVRGGDECGASGWSLRELTPGFGCVAAVAVEGDGWRLGCWQWEA